MEPPGRYRIGMFGSEGSKRGPGSEWFFPASFGWGAGSGWRGLNISRLNPFNGDTGAGVFAVLPRNSHRSRMLHWGHFGLRAMHT